MGKGMRGGWHLGLLAGLCSLAAAGSAALDRTAETVVTPMKYAWVGADTGLRTNLQRGLTQLDAADVQGAVRSLNRAIWDLQRVEDRGLRKPDSAEDQWKLSAAFGARSRQPAGPGGGPSPLDRGKAAYVSAQFPESVSWLQQAFPDLEEAEEFGVRLKRLEEARCYLGFSYVALGQEERAKEEFQRLVALDAAVTFCSDAAAPKIRRLISEVQRSMAR